MLTGIVVFLIGLGLGWFAKGKLGTEAKEVLAEAKELKDKFTK